MSATSKRNREKDNRVLAFWCCAGLVLVTVVAYWQSFNHPFLRFDDPLYVSKNPHVQGGLTLENIHWALTTFDASAWQPLTWISLELDASIFGGQNARGFHATNVLLHALNAVLVFLLLLRMTNQIGRCAIVAALFALHPLRVESVAWVTERKDVLSTLFLVLSLHAYVGYVRHRSLFRYGLAMILLLLGLMSKPMLVTTPFLLLLLDYWPLRRWQSGSPRAQTYRLLLEKIPFLCLVLLISGVTLVAHSKGSDLVPTEQVPIPVRIWNALLAYEGYLTMMLWPINLAVYYPHPYDAVSIPAALVAAVLLVAITYLVLVPGRARPYLVVGWLWYLVSLLPVIGIVQLGGQALADRFCYVPLLGPFLMLTWGISDLLASWRISPLGQRAVAFVVLAICMALTWRQVGYWESDLVLWQRALAVTENNAQAHYHVGNAYLVLGRQDRALEHYQKSLAINPSTAKIHHNLAGLLRQRGDFEGAVREYRQAIDWGPDLAAPHQALGTLFLELGQRDRAAQEYRTASQLDPASSQAFFALGLILDELGQTDLAIANLEKAVALEPEGAAQWGALGQALLHAGRYTEAQKNAEHALSLLPQSHPLRGEISKQLARGKHLQDLETRLPGPLEGKQQTQNAAEQLELAGLCQLPRHARYAAAARLYVAAFAADPALANDLLARHRFLAACAAIRAAAGQGTDSSNLTPDDQKQLRTLALNWLREDLALDEKLARSPRPSDRGSVSWMLRQSMTEPALASVRDSGSLAKLGEKERADWSALWDGADRILRSIPDHGAH